MDGAKERGQIPMIGAAAHTLGVLANSSTPGIADGKHGLHEYLQSQVVYIRY